MDLSMSGRVHTAQLCAAESEDANSSSQSHWCAKPHKLQSLRGVFLPEQQQPNLLCDLNLGCTIFDATSHSPVSDLKGNRLEKRLQLSEDWLGPPVKLCTLLTSTQRYNYTNTQKIQSWGCPHTICLNRLGLREKLKREGHYSTVK